MGGGDLGGSCQEQRGPGPARKGGEHPRLRKPADRRRKPGAFAMTFGVMAVFWVVLSGKLDLFHISLGIASCLIVAALSCDLLLPEGLSPALPGRWLRFAGYIPWLLYQIILASLHLLYLSFHPRMMDLIDPHIVRFDSRLKSDIARTTFANSITLTPGTITVDVNPLGQFAVHCIDVPSGQALPGEMERRVAHIFKE